MKSRCEDRKRWPLVLSRECKADLRGFPRWLRSCDAASWKSFRGRLYFRCHFISQHRVLCRSRRTLGCSANFQGFWEMVFGRAAWGSWVLDRCASLIVDIIVHFSYTKFFFVHVRNPKLPTPPVDFFVFVWPEGNLNNLRTALCRSPWWR